MRQRWKLILALVGAVAGLSLGTTILLGWEPIRLIASIFEQSRPTVRIGLLHSQTGSLSISEKSLLDAEVFAIDEINASGGIGNRKIVYSAPDCRSDPIVYASQSRQLLEQDKAVALFGCWTSECRKAVVPVLNEKSGLLFFPGNFEGIEISPRVIYGGGSANQSVLPAVRWAFDTLKARRFFVIGVEEVWSRCSSEISKDAIKAAGAELVGEVYQPPSAPNIDALVAAIQQAKPDLVLNFMYGNTNLKFYSAIRKAGLTPDKLPMIAFGFSEDEAQRFTPADVVDQYAAWNYFQSVPRSENLEFVKKFRQKNGENRVVGDAMIAAYNNVKFWARTAQEVDPGDIAGVLASLNRQSLNSPDGIVTIDPETRIVWRPFHLGRFRSSGQFEIIYSISKPIRPVTFVGTRSADQWRSFLEELKTRWNGRWSAPS